MTRDDFLTMWKMLTGVWPRMDTPETAAAWWGLIGHYPSHHATAAVRKWATDRRSAPSPADIIDGIKMIAIESRQTSQTRSIDAAPCDECESTGFVWTSMVGHGTVRRCPRGCTPPIIDHSRTTHDHAPRANPRIWIDRMNEIREREAARRREMGEREYLRSRNIDPDAFTFSHGMLVARTRSL